MMIFYKLTYKDKIDFCYIIYSSKIKSNGRMDKNLFDEKAQKNKKVNPIKIIP